MWTPPKKDRCDSCPDGPEIAEKDCGHSTTMDDLNCTVCVEVHGIVKQSPMGSQRQMHTNHI
jgi:hypothetical protein